MRPNNLAVIILLYALSVVAQPPQPSGYYGTVTVNGDPAQVGVEISAWINGVNYPTNFVVNSAGQYGIMSVNGDDPSTTQKEGGVNNETVLFKIKIGNDYYDASPSSVWETGVNHQVNLIADTGPTTGTIEVVTNLPQSTFTITGPATYVGSGTFWSIKGATPGNYTISYTDIVGYIKPANETKELIAGGVLTFSTTYSALSGKGKSLLINIKDGTSHAIPLQDIVQIKFSGITKVKDIKKLGGVLKSFMLMQNYPNPFNPTTTIEYFIPKPGDVEIGIYNVKGQLVKHYKMSLQAEGFHQVIWDGLNENSQHVASGLYIYQIKYDSKVLTKRMLIIK